MTRTFRCAVVIAIALVAATESARPDPIVQSRLVSDDDHRRRARLRQDADGGSGAPEEPDELLHKFLHNPGHGQLTRGIIGALFDSVWCSERGGAMRDDGISGRLRIGRGLKNRRLLAEAFCASSDVTYTHNLR